MFHTFLALKATSVSISFWRLEAGVIGFDSVFLILVIFEASTLETVYQKITITAKTFHIPPK
nr:MAG TPA: hypothetical protein [Caudoviricetes sp.]